LSLHAPYRINPIANKPNAIENFIATSVLCRDSSVFDAGVIRQICQELVKEKDSHRVQELVSLLQAVIRDDQEEFRLRLHYLAKKYEAALKDEATREALRKKNGDPRNPRLDPSSVVVHEHDGAKPPVES